MTDPQIVVRATSDFRRLNSDLSKTESHFGRMGSTIKAGLIGGAVAGGAALIKLASDSVGAASLSQQSIGATESVFGKYADTVIKRSEQASDAVGLSANEYRELANVTGAMLASSGRPLREVADLTDKLEHRAADMAATFGGTTKEAIEAVSSLLRGEADPIERYGVAIKQSDVSARLAAQGLDDLTGKALKQAEQQARLSLLFGQTSKTAGQFARESDTLAGAQQRLGAKVEDVEASFGELLLPIMTDVTNWAGNELVPALEDLQGWLSDNKDEIRDTASSIKDGLLPPLQASTDLVKAAAGFWSDLPGPVKDLGVQAGVAALVVPRLTGSISRYVDKVKTAEGRTVSLKGAMSSAAGVTGALALSHGIGETNDALRGLELAGGGALTGFAAGGPWGAAIGAGIGLLLSMKDVSTENVSNFRAFGDALSDFKVDVNSANGAVNQLTRSQVAQNLIMSGAAAAGQVQGLTLRQLVDATLGQSGAMKTFSKAIGENQGYVFQWIDTAGTLQTRIIDSKADVDRLTKGAARNASEIIGVSDANQILGRTLKDQRQAFRQSVHDTRATALAAQDLKGKWDKIPDRIETSVHERGIPVTIKSLGKLAARYNLTPKEIKTLIRVSDSELSIKKVKRVQEELDKTEKKHTEPKVTLDSGDFDKHDRTILKSLDDLDNKLVSPSSTLKLDDYYTKRAQLISSLHTIPDEYVNVWITRREGGGNGDGNGAGSGRLIPTMPELEKTGVGAGTTLGKAIVVGLNRVKPGKSILSVLLNAVVGGSEGIESAIEKLNKLVEQRTKDDKAGNARQKQILRGLADEYAALKRNGKAQDEINRKLEKAKEHLSEVRAFVDGIRDSFIATGDVTQLGQLEDGTVSGTLLIDQLRDQVAHAQRFADLTRELTAEGLNQTSLQQLLQAGPEAGLATAEALAAGGDAALAEINNLTQQLEASGQTLGGQMSDQFFDVGLQASLGLVQGLEAQDAALDRAAQRLARKLAAAVRHALGIKSPSKEFESIGLDTVRGLTLGLDDTYVRRQGRKVALALVDGFATPKLGATAGAGEGPTQNVTITVNADRHTDGLRVGKEIASALDHAGARGVRRRAIGGVR